MTLVQWLSHNPSTRVIFQQGPDRATRYTDSAYRFKSVRKRPQPPHAGRRPAASGKRSLTLPIFSTDSVDKSNKMPPSENASNCLSCIKCIWRKIRQIDQNRLTVMDSPQLNA
jgi:hypothetical protein